MVVSHVGLPFAFCEETEIIIRQIEPADHQVEAARDIEKPTGELRSAAEIARPAL